MIQLKYNLSRALKLAKITNSQMRQVKSKRYPKSINKEKR